MKRTISIFALGAIFGVVTYVIACVVYVLWPRNRDQEYHLPPDPPQNGGSDLDHDLDPRIHGEFRGPDNPAPGTEKWFEMRAEEVVETADPEDGVDDLVADFCARFGSKNPSKVAEYIERELESRG